MISSLVIIFLHLQDPLSILLVHLLQCTALAESIARCTPVDLIFTCFPS